MKVNKSQNPDTARKLGKAERAGKATSKKAATPASEQVTARKLPPPPRAPPPPPTPAHLIVAATQQASPEQFHKLVEQLQSRFAANRDTDGKLAAAKKSLGGPYRAPSSFVAAHILDGTNQDWLPSSVTVARHDVASKLPQKFAALFKTLVRAPLLSAMDRKDVTNPRFLEDYFTRIKDTAGADGFAHWSSAMHGEAHSHDFEILADLIGRALDANDAAQNPPLAKANYESALVDHVGSLAHQLATKFQQDPASVHPAEVKQAINLAHQHFLELGAWKGPLASAMTVLQTLNVRTAEESQGKIWS